MHATLVCLTILLACGLVAAAGAGIASHPRRESPTGVHLVASIAGALGTVALTSALLRGTLMLFPEGAVVPVGWMPGPTWLLRVAAAAAAAGLVAAAVGFATRVDRPAWTPRAPATTSTPRDWTRATAGPVLYDPWFPHWLIVEDSAVATAALVAAALVLVPGLVVCVAVASRAAVATGGDAFADWHPRMRMGG